MKQQLIVLIGVFVLGNFFCLPCAVSAAVGADCRTLSISLSRSNVEPGEQISIQTQSNCSGIDGVVLYYISARDAYNWDQVCKWPGGWHTIGRVAAGGSLSWTVPSEGEYFIVGNLLKSNGSAVCTGAFGWEPNQSCVTPKCIQGYTVLKVGYDMAQYWNMMPGNYWIFEGYNYHMGVQGRVRWEVEQKTDLCGKTAGEGTASWPVLITKSTPYAYWGTAFTRQQAFSKEQANPQGSFFSVKKVEPGQGIASNTFSIQVKGIDSYGYPAGTSKVALYYISAQDAYNVDKVCVWPGGWHTLGTITVSGGTSSLLWTAPSEGEYFIAGNLLSGNIATCTGAFSWVENQVCPQSPPKCMDGYARVGNNQYDSNIRLWFTQFSKNCPYGDSSCFGFSFWPIYERKADCAKYEGKWTGECHQQGELWSTPAVGVDFVSGVDDASVPYYQSPAFLTNPSRIYSTKKQYFFGGIKAGNVQDASYCGTITVPPARADGDYIKETIGYQRGDVETPAYKGNVLIVKQGELRGWTTREDWYLAKNIGLVKIAEKTLGTETNYGGDRCQPQSHNCACGNILEPVPGDDQDCAMDHLITKPRWEMKLSKYYLGNELNVGLNGSAHSITVSPGDSFSLSVSDPSTGFSYEGILEAKAEFISPDGVTVSQPGQWNYWFNESGEIKIKLSHNFPPGVYTTRFRSWVRRSQKAIDSGVETITIPAKLPWSNEVTITVN